MATFDLQSGETVTCTYTNTELAKVTITKTDDDNPGQPVNGAVFGIYEDISPASTLVSGRGGLQPGDAEQPRARDDVFGRQRRDVQHGQRARSGQGLLGRGDHTPSGYTTAAPQRITPTAGQNVTLTFVDKREFKVITLVCQNSNNSLYPSSVSLNKEGSGSDTATSMSAAQLAAFNTAHGTSITAAQLCDLTGAAFSPRHHGSYDGNVNIPQ